MSKHYNFSVIIPHYNSPKLLERCLASIPDEDDIQVIVVDDNSSPQKVDFDHFPGLDRKYTQVIFNKDSHGAGHARNLALPLTLGDWLLFADADDYFTHNAWNTIKRVSSNKNADIIYLNIQSVDSETGEVLQDRGFSYIKHLNNYIKTKDQDWEYRLRFWNNTPWGKLIKRELVANNNITFGETTHANDVLFSTKTATKALQIDATDEICYCVTRTKGSLTQIQTLEAMSLRYEVCLQKNLILRQSGYRKYEFPIHTFIGTLAHYRVKGLWNYIKLTCKYHGSLYRSLYWFFKIRKENKN